MAKTLILVLLLIAAVYSVYVLFRPTEINTNTCPQREYINCQPVVSEENAPYCYNDYQTWIEQNCPDVQYVY